MDYIYLNVPNPTIMTDGLYYPKGVWLSKGQVLCLLEDTPTIDLSVERIALS